MNKSELLADNYSKKIDDLVVSLSSRKYSVSEFFDAISDVIDSKTAERITNALLTYTFHTANITIVSVTPTESTRTLSDTTPAKRSGKPFNSSDLEWLQIRQNEKKRFGFYILIGGGTCSMYDIFDFFYTGKHSHSSTKFSLEKAYDLTQAILFKAGVYWADSVATTAFADATRTQKFDFNKIDCNKAYTAIIKLFLKKGETWAQCAKRISDGFTECVDLNISIAAENRKKLDEYYGIPLLNDQEANEYLKDIKKCPLCTAKRLIGSVAVNRNETGLDLKPYNYDFFTVNHIDMPTKMGHLGRLYKKDDVDFFKKKLGDIRKRYGKEMSINAVGSVDLAVASKFATSKLPSPVTNKEDFAVLKKAYDSIKNFDGKDGVQTVLDLDS